MAKEFVIKHGLIVHGEITGSDIRIDDWNSVSASLSELSSNVGETVTTASISGNVITFTKSDGTTFETVVQEDTGSFFTSASVDYNRVTFTQGDGTTSYTITIDTGSFEPDRQDTGSFFTSASVDLNTITFHYGASGSFGSLTVDTGSNFISNVVLDPSPTGSSLIFTGEGGAFNGAVDMSRAYQQGGGMTLNYSGSVLFNAASEWTGGNPNRKVSSTVTSMRDSGWNEWRFSDISRNFSSQYHNNSYNESVFDLITSVVNHTGQLIVRVYDDRNSAYEGFYMNSGSATIKNNAGGAGDLSLYLKHIGGRGWGATSATPGNNTINNTNVAFSFTGTQLYESGSQSQSAFNEASVTSNVVTLTRDDGTREILTIDTGIITGSVTGNTLTFTKEDESTFNLTVDTGSQVTPDTPLNTFQFNSSGEFGGSTLYFDDTTKQVGINIDVPRATFHVRGANNGTGSLLIETDSVGGSESGFAKLDFRVADNDGGAFKKFAIIAENEGGGTNEANYGLGQLHFALNNDLTMVNATIADSKLTLDHEGNIYMPDIDTGTTLNTIYYNTTSGELTYGLAPTGSSGTVSGSIQVDHDATLNFVANEHIDHSTITIGSGRGLAGGGTIDTNRSLALDTGSAHFLDGVKEKLNIEGVFSGSVSPAGSNTELQFNDNGAFGATTGITYSSSPQMLDLDSTSILIEGKSVPIQLTEGSSASKQTVISYAQSTTSNVGFRVGNNDLGNTGRDIFVIAHGTTNFAASNTTNIFELDQAGSLIMSAYGSGTNTGNPGYYLAVDSTGRIVEELITTGSGGGGTIDTGSFYVDSSVNLNTITFTKGDGLTEVITVDTGSGLTGNGSVGQIALWDASKRLNGDGHFVWNPLNNRMGINIASPESQIHIDGYGQPIRLTSTSNTQMYIRYQNQNSTSEGMRVGNDSTSPYGGDNFVVQWDSGNPSANSWEEIFRVSGSGETFMVGLDNATTSNTLYYNSSTGEVTYGAAPSGSGGGGSGTVNTGVAGYLAYYPSNGTTVDDQTGLFWDESSGELGIGTANPARPLHIDSSNAVPIRLSSTDENRQVVQYFGENSNGAGVLVGTEGENDFVVLQSDYSTNTVNTNLYVSESGETYLPRLAADATPSDVVYYDSSTGELSYGSAPSGGGTDTSIYSTDGTLSTNRTLDFNGNGLTFDILQGETFGIAAESNATVGIALDNSEFQITGLASSTTANVLGIDASGNIKTMSTSSFTGGGGGGSGTVNTGVAGYLAYYPSNGTTVDDQTGLYWNESNGRLGLGTTNPLRAFEIQDQGVIPVRLKSSTDNAQLIQLFGANSTGAGIRVGTIGINDFTVQQSDPTENVVNTNLYVSESGETYLPRLAADATPSDVVYYDSSTGELSYGSAPSGGSGETYDLNVTQASTSVILNLDSTSGTDDSSVQLDAGTGITLTRNASSRFTIASSGGGSGTPGGSTTQVQFNNAGSFGGDAGFVYDSVNDRVGLGVPVDPTNTLHLTKGDTPILLDGNTAAEDSQYIQFLPDGLSTELGMRIGVGYSSTYKSVFTLENHNGTSWSDIINIRGDAGGGTEAGLMRFPAYATTQKLLLTNAQTNYITATDNSGFIYKVPFSYNKNADSYGIGTTAPNAKLHINGFVGSGSASILTSHNIVSGAHLNVASRGHFGSTNSASSGQLQVTGNVSGVSIYASHDIVAYSDARSKVNIETIPDALEKVNAVRGVTYNKVDDPEGMRYMGVIAQELLEHLPEVVHQGEEGNYSVAYGNVVGVLIEAVKELTAKVEDLESRLGK